MIHVEDRGDADRVRLVTIDRPERRNALDLETIEALLVAVEGAGLRAESEPGVGSCFTLELPLTDPGEPGRAA